jgi:lactaldehyde dehydrogenase/glycolaldehyde dehydrogenase
VELPVLSYRPQAGAGLITGNTIVIKPSEFTPNNAIAFAEIVHQVGLPKGVFNLVLGRGETVGQELAGNRRWRWSA